MAGTGMAAAQLMAVLSLSLSSDHQVLETSFEEVAP